MKVESAEAGHNEGRDAKNIHLRKPRAWTQGMKSQDIQQLPYHAIAILESLKTRGRPEVDFPSSDSLVFGYGTLLMILFSD